MTNDVRSVQPANAPFSIDITVLGIVVFLQPRINAFFDVSIMALQLSRES